MADERVMLTVIVHHDQSKPLEEILAPIAAQLKRDHA